MEKETKPIEDNTPYWNVCVESYSGKKGFAESLEILENNCGKCNGSGSIGQLWEAYWYEIETEVEAKAIAEKAALFDFVDQVSYYQNNDANIYVKGKT